MENSTKNFNEKMSNLMKQFLEKEKELFDELINNEKNKAQKLMMDNIGSEDLRLKENWDQLVELGLAKGQFYSLLNNRFYSYSFKEGSDYFIRFKNNEFMSDSIKNALIISNYDTEYEDIDSFYEI